MPMGARGHWIDGAERPSVSGKTFDVFDPGNGELLYAAASGGEADAAAAVESARRAFGRASWSGLDGRDRASLLFSLARLIARDRPRLERVLSLENGKPFALSGHEVDTAIRYCEYYGGWADKIDGRRIPAPGAKLAFTSREPVGVVVQIIPWNYPLDILLRGAAPALAAGNAVVAKPAEDTPAIALEIASLAKEAGFPDGIFNVLLGYGNEAGAALTAHPGIHGIAFCGSAATAGRIAAAAAPNLVPVLSLELGGKCPSLVLPDGNAVAAADAIAGGIVYNAGQSCVARSRLVLPRRALDTALEAISRRLKGVRLGHCSAEPDMGPIINGKQRDKVFAAIEAGRRSGAVLAVGGAVPDSPELARGHFVPPTVFADVPEDSALAREEIFGPVLSVVCYDGDAADGIRIANDTNYGLAAELWSADPATALGAAEALNASHVTINGSGGFGIEVPFGGIGRSGYGREGGLEGLLQYTRVKSVYMGVRRFGATPVPPTNPAE